MDIDWSKITVYEVDPRCENPRMAAITSYWEGCRCLRCANAKRRAAYRPEREPRYIPQREWRTP
jgi:hypothetical protein